MVKVGNHQVMLTHGHYYGVNYGYEKIAAAAHVKGCDVVYMDILMFRSMMYLKALATQVRACE
jgi:hypothetical protein